MYYKIDQLPLLFSLRSSTRQEEGKNPYNLAAMSLQQALLQSMV